MTGSPGPAAAGTNIFTETSARAEQFGAVNLGQGFPDVSGPAQVVEAAVRALRDGRNQYPPVPGTPALREAVAHHQLRWYGLTLDPIDEVLITVGASEALAASLLAFVRPGDEVIVLEPFYDLYAAVTRLAGGRVVPVRLTGPGFRLDPERLAAAVTDRTRVLLLNSPHNPTGTVLGEEELHGVAAIADAHNLLVVTDEVYEHLVYDHHRHIPFAGLPSMRDRTISISSAGKTFSLTGWKIGWATGPAHLLAQVRAVKQYLSFAAGTPLQHAIAVALGLGDDYFIGLRSDYQRRRDLLVDGLAAVGFAPCRPAGTFFVTADIGRLSGEDGLAFCHHLPQRCGVAAIPNQVFYADPGAAAGRRQVRFTFAKPDHVLSEALHRLRQGFGAG